MHPETKPENILTIFIAKGSYVPTTEEGHWFLMVAVGGGTIFFLGIVTDNLPML